MSHSPVNRGKEWRQSILEDQKYKYSGIWLSCRHKINSCFCLKWSSISSRAGKASQWSMWLSVCSMWFLPSEGPHQKHRVKIAQALPLLCFVLWFHKTKEWTYPAVLTAINHTVISFTRSLWRPSNPLFKPGPVLKTHEVPQDPTQCSFEFLQGCGPQCPPSLCSVLCDSSGLKDYFMQFSTLLAEAK